MVVALLFGLATTRFTIGVGPFLLCCLLVIAVLRAAFGPRVAGILSVGAAAILYVSFSWLVYTTAHPRPHPAEAGAVVLIVGGAMGGLVGLVMFGIVEGASRVVNWADKVLETKSTIVTELSRERRHRSRRLFQFSLRALLVFVLLVSVGMSWFAVKLEKARRQKEAVEVIEKAGGSVAYEFEWTRSERPSVLPIVAKWVRALCGDDFFYDVVWVGVFFGDFGDDEAIYLKRLTGLICLEIGNTQITDAGLEHVKALTSLQELNLTGTQVTDAGLKHLEGLTSLIDLSLMGTQITDAGLTHLEGLTSLEGLNLCGTQVTDQGLESIRRLSTLVGLDLCNTQITDAGLERLEELTSLHALFLRGTQVTPEGVKKLQEALPDCEIVY
ncbi:leucine-rich repeat domain-containing protein [Planctomycetota bacterium]